MSLPRSACAAVGCALPSSHSSAAECRLSAARAPLWAACCLVAPNAAECRLPAARAPLWAACCHPNTECRGSAVRTQLWAAHCLCRIRVPQNVVAPQCVRRCGLRIAFDASKCPRISSHPNAEQVLQCVRRCGPRIAFVASVCPCISQT